jgi:hypothetical protein
MASSRLVGEAASVVEQRGRGGTLRCAVLLCSGLGWAGLRAHHALVGAAGRGVHASAHGRHEVGHRVAVHSVQGGKRVEQEVQYGAAAGDRAVHVARGADADRRLLRSSGEGRGEEAVRSGQGRARGPHDAPGCLAIRPRPASAPRNQRPRRSGRRHNRPTCRRHCAAADLGPKRKFLGGSCLGLVHARGDLVCRGLGFLQVGHQRLVLQDVAGTGGQPGGRGRGRPHEPLWDRRPGLAWPLPLPLWDRWPGRAGPLPAPPHPSSPPSKPEVRPWVASTYPTLHLSFGPRLSAVQCSAVQCSRQLSKQAAPHT